MWFFSFSSIRGFIRALAKTEGEFTKAVHHYNDEFQCKSIEVDNWFDLGHINTYFLSRSTITTQRAFNNLKIQNGIVWKSGSPAQKIEAEASWFQNLPASLKHFTPQLIQAGYSNDAQPFYEIEYLPYLPLNEIFVHGKNPPIFWEKLLGLISQYMYESRKALQISETLKENIHQDSLALYRDKTFERLEKYASQVNLDLNKTVKYDGIDLPCLYDIAKECIEETIKLPEIPAIVHGDLCFSNILYDTRSNGIKVIDPRGLNIKQELVLYGNQSYDLAKLCHSFIGLYDFIISDSFNLEYDESIGVRLIFNIDDRLKEIQKIFMKKQLLQEITNNDIIPATILLFLSMLPLHFDQPKRQEAMLLNALRLYIEWKKLL